MRRLVNATILAITVALVFSGIALAYALSWVREPWTGSDYHYTVTSDAALGAGEVICVQYKSNLDGWVYHQAECTGSGTTWTCTVPGPVTGTGTTGYNYEFYAHTSGNCANIGTGNSWTGEQWQETNATTALTIEAVAGRSPLSFTLIGACFALGALAVVQRKRS